ncbi:MAG: NUDIX domain-containing protein [Bacteroidota bacterium]
MPISTYLRDLRALVGTRCLLVPGVAAVIHNEAGHVLLMRRSDNGRWSLPAGSIDPGEAPREAVLREVAEETGLTVTATHLLDAVGGGDYRTRYPNGDEVEYTVCVFACEVQPGMPAAVDGEATAFRWAAPADVPALLDLPYPSTLFLPR